ncbi:unnamed protein product [Nezara viridula]|uniref:Uncharacterized protein n=1 Tax=Nezara viridula TaxID=85310 RepID=A0A9P0HCZ1_NEZVI|nr:unnamed protein product [Nezara viridula]
MSVFHIVVRDDLCSLGLGLSSFPIGIVVFIYHLLHQKRLKHITDHIDLFSKRISQLGQEKLFLTLFMKKSRLVPTIAKVLICMPFLTIFVYVIPVPVSDWFNGTYRSRRPLPTQGPFDDKQPGVYELLLFLEAFSISSCCRKNATDCLFMALFKSHSAVLQYLSAAMDDIQRDFSSGDNDKGHRKLALWLKLHQDIVM